MERIEGPKEETIIKTAEMNPQWTSADWEVWWCRWGRKRWPQWNELKVCEKCNCERKDEQKAA